VLNDQSVQAMKSIKDWVGFIGLAIALLTAGIGLYRSIIQSQMITAQNQERIKDVAEMIDAMMDRQLKIQEKYFEHDRRLTILEHEIEGDE